MPWLPLSGMDSSIIENSKQLGLEKYIASLEGLCKTRFARKRAPMVKLRAQARDAVRGLKAVTITAGPKSVYEMIDSVRTNH